MLTEGLFCYRVLPGAIRYSLTSLGQQQGAMPTSALEQLDTLIAPRTYLVGYDMTLADLAVYSAVRGERGRGFCKPGAGSQYPRPVVVVGRSQVGIFM